MQLESGKRRGTALSLYNPHRACITINEGRDKSLGEEWTEV
ncbi:MAG: hypothetical protein ACLP59_01140 [Bryobacteraceae bacterium]